MDWKEIIKEKNIHYHRLSSLITLMIALMVTMITIVTPFFIDYFPKDYQLLLKLVLLLLPQFLLIGHWYTHRFIFPKGKKGVHYIVVAIETENEKQKERISKDFSSNLKKLIIDYQLNNDYDVLILHNAHAIELKKIIHNAFYLGGDKSFNNKYIKKFDKINDKMNSKFIVFGDLISRDSPNNKYILNIEGLIRHKTVPEKFTNLITKEFKEIWENEISFLEENESTEFKSTSGQIFFAALYMLQLATVTDLNHEKGIEIGNKLLEYVRNNKKYKEFESKVINSLTLSYFLFSKALYLIGDYDKSTFYRRKYNEIVKHDYDSYLTEALFQVNKRNDPQTALEFIEKAKQIASKDGTWRYSKFYLLIRLNRLDEALNIFDEILLNTFKNELDIINQVITYNRYCLEKDINHIQTFFIIGALVFKKLNNASFAYEKLEEFITHTNNKLEWKPLNERANQYLKEIKEIMQIKEE